MVCLPAGYRKQYLANYTQATITPIILYASSIKCTEKNVKQKIEIYWKENGNKMEIIRLTNGSNGNKMNVGGKRHDYRRNERTKKDSWIFE